MRLAGMDPLPSRGRASDSTLAVKRRHAVRRLRFLSHLFDVDRSPPLPLLPLRGLRNIDGGDVIA